MDYRKQILGCWLGKAVGGTLGAPYEGSLKTLALTFYDPVPTEMLPNDDLDLQVLWACKLAGEWNGEISGTNFARAWRDNVAFPFDEYGVAIRNIKMGIMPPQSGQYDNAFVDGLGAAIRSELWACLAPGNPELAVKYAYEDARVDHDGDGIYAEQYLAALESLAFVEHDITILIDKALAYIPADSLLAAAIKHACGLCRRYGAEKITDIYQEILRFCGNDNFTDVNMNLPFVVAGLLLGGGDFAKTICTAVNFGRDTDCTGATAGAIMGILAPDAIPDAWLRPIGRNIVLSKEITGVTPPPTLDGFTDLVIGLRDKVHIARGDARPADLSAFAVSARKSYLRPWSFLDGPTPVPSMPGTAETLKLAGNLAHVDFAQMPADGLLLLEIAFTLPAAMDTRLMVNTPAAVRVWLDGEYKFGRDGGEFVPAFHRQDGNQFSDQALAAGKHRILIGMAPLTLEMKRRGAPLLFGLADRQNQWIAGIFHE